MAKLKYTNEMGGVLNLERLSLLIRKIDGLGSPSISSTDKRHFFRMVHQHNGCYVEWLELI